MITPKEVIHWLNAEGILELSEGFAPDGELFAAGLDSMAVMQMVIAAEEEFGVILSPADMTRENLRSPQALAALISAKSST